MLTNREAATILGVTEQHAQRLHKIGALGDMSRAAVEAVAAKRADRPLSLRAAAAILGCSHENVRCLSISGALPDLRRSTVEALKASGYAQRPVALRSPGRPRMTIVLPDGTPVEGWDEATRITGWSDTALRDRAYQDGPRRWIVTRLPS